MLLLNTDNIYCLITHDTSTPGHNARMEVASTLCWRLVYSFFSPIDVS